MTNPLSAVDQEMLQAFAEYTDRGMFGTPASPFARFAGKPLAEVQAWLERMVDARVLTVRDKARMRTRVRTFQLANRPPGR